MLCYLCVVCVSVCVCVYNYDTVTLIGLEVAVYDTFQGRIGLLDCLCLSILLISMSLCVAFYTLLYN